MTRIRMNNIDYYQILTLNKIDDQKWQKPVLERALTFHRGCCSGDRVVSVLRRQELETVDRGHVVKA